MAPTVIPYAPSAGWYAAWLHALSEGMGEDEAPAAANVAAGIAGKDFARCRIGGGQLLSIAVEGGASILKRGANVACARLSGHGNWPHVHLGALEAVYGRTPYYQHLMPLLRPVYESAEGSLADFNKRIHHALCAMLPAVGSFRRGRETVPNVEERCREVARQIDMSLSLVDAVMRLGPEAVLGLG